VDRLAAEGVRFTNAYVTQAVCSPSRASIYTGLFPHQNGQIGLATHHFTTVAGVPSLPKLLGAAGYRTGLIGKLHVLPEEAFPFDFRWADPRVVSFAHRDVKKTTEIAGKFMAAGEKPFFLTVCFADAHLPFLPQDTGLPAAPLTAESKLTMWPDVGVDTPRLRGHLANYYNCISRLDTGIGLVLDELEKSGQAKNTVVVYVGDHGPQFARGKVTSYELGLRVPLVVRWPGRAAASVRDELVSTVDLLPTLVSLAGGGLPEKLAGRSLVPILEGKRPDWRKYLFAEWNTSHTGTGPILNYPQRTIRDERYKLILNVTPASRNPAEEYYTSQVVVQTGPTQAEIDAAPAGVRATYATWRASPPVELYDLAADPHELVNVAERADLGPVRERLLAELAHWRAETSDPMLDPAKQKLLADEHQEQHERVSTEGRKAYKPWRYPQYLYAAAPDQAASRGDRPNFVLLFIDNLGYGDLGCYGNAAVKTPHIDRLAGEGVRCTDFYIGSPSCSPSRGAILTGRHPVRNGLNYQLSAQQNASGEGLPRTEKIIPQYLAPLGYTCGAFGKWNIGFAEGSRPTDRGFHEFLGHMSGNIHYFKHLYHGANDLRHGTEPLDRRGQHSTDLFADAAIDFMRKHQSQPFFVYLPFNAVHFVGANNVEAGEKIEWQVPQKFLARFGASADEPDQKIRFRAVLAALDNAVGRVLASIDSLGLRERTVVLLISDNGAFMLPGRGLEVQSNAPVRAGGVTTYEGGIRVPAMVRWPGRIKPGTVCREMLSSLDVLPLLVAAAAGELPAEGVLDGRDPAKTLAGEAPSPHDALYWSWKQGKEQWSALRRGPHKLVRSADDRPWELYNLAADLSEKNDLAASRPQLVQELGKQFAEWQQAAK
jgi:arylsulfatase A-like enzyme